MTASKFKSEHYAEPTVKWWTQNNTNWLSNTKANVYDHQAKCEKPFLKNITTLKRRNQTKVDGLKKKTSNNCSDKSGQLRVTSLVLEEQLKVTNKNYTLELRTWPWYSNEKWNHMDMQWEKPVIHAFVIKSPSDLSVKSSKLWANIQLLYVWLWF